MSPDLARLFATLLSLLGPAPESDVNIPRELILKPGDRIIAIGDSITQQGGYLKDVDAVLAEKYPDLKLPPIRNVGIGGQKAENLIKRFTKDVVDREPAVVLLSIGINDVWHRAGRPHDPQILADYWSNVSKMVEMAQAAGIKVILLTPTVIKEDASSKENLRLRIYVEAEKQIARDRACTLVDLHAMFISALGKRPEDVPPGKNWLTGDGVHMAPTGDALMALGVLRGLGVPTDKLSPTEPAEPKPAEPKPADR